MDSDGDDNNAEHSLFVCVPLFIVVCFAAVPEYICEYTRKNHGRKTTHRHYS